MSHTLSSCKTALSQGRYRWRHDQVLRELSDVLEVEEKNTRPPMKSKPSFIRFVKAEVEHHDSTQNSHFRRDRDIIDVGRCGKEINVSGRGSYIFTSGNCDMVSQVQTYHYDRANSVLGEEM